MCHVLHYVDLNADEVKVMEARLISYTSKPNWRRAIRLSPVAGEADPAEARDIITWQIGGGWKNIGE
jgi:hypothetical protein